MKKQFYSMGEVLAYLKSNDITNIEERALYIQDFINKENTGAGYEYDRYIEHGASNFSNVITESSGTKKECILWCVNHYLSLNRSERIIEKKIAKLVGKEKSILFPTGFTANVAAISCLTAKNDLIIFDRECHSYIINGLKLSSAKWISFKHNNVIDLESKISKYKNSYDNIFVLIESAYSMSGDLAPLKEIVSLKKQYNFYLYVDEAHTFGIYGDEGQGYCYHEGVSEDVDFIMSTLSKSTASIGGFVATKEKYCSILKWSDPYVFQAYMTPVDASVVLLSLEEIERNSWMIKDLHKKNRFMRELLERKGFNLGSSQSPIIPIFIEDHKKLGMVVKDLYDEGIYSTPICYPAVKLNEGRTRLILNINYTEEHIKATANALEKVCKKHKVL